MDETVTCDNDPSPHVLHGPDRPCRNPRRVPGCVLHFFLQPSCHGCQVTLIDDHGARLASLRARIFGRSKSVEFGRTEAES